MPQANVPEWLTADFFKSCLQSDLGSSKEIAITSLHIDDAVPEGNNYGSQIFRATLQYKVGDEENQNSLSLIVKIPIDTGFLEKLLDFKDEIFKREPKFYNIFINETYKLCKHDIVPKYYSCPSPHCVVMEDLITSGYSMVDRRKLLDLDHCEYYIKSSSKLHALSMALYEKNPEMIESVTNISSELIQTVDNMNSELLKTSFKCIIAYLEDLPKYKKYSDIIKEGLEDDIIVKLYIEMNNARRPVNALQQGDPWCTNMMFKYNSSGQVVGIKLVDFQAVKFTSPFWDLITFLWSSANMEVRDTKIDYLYNLYLNCLNTHLKEFGCSARLSLEDMRTEISFLSPLILFCVCGFVPGIVNDEPLDHDALLNSTHTTESIKGNSAYKAYQSTNFKKFYPNFIDHIIREGVFDDVKEKIRQFKLTQEHVN